MQRKNIIPLVQYSRPDERITKQMREETNNKFYKKLNSLKASKVTIIKKLTPIKKIRKNFSLPKLNFRFNSIINNKEKEKDLTSREKGNVLIKRSKYFDKYMTFEEKMILNFYGNAIQQRMKARPKKINDLVFRQFKSNFLKSKENYRKIDERRLNEENIIYKRGIRRFNDNYANFSNKIVDKSMFSLRNKFRLKID